MRFYRHSVMCMSLSVNLGIRLSVVASNTLTAIGVPRSRAGSRSLSYSLRSHLDNMPISDILENNCHLSSAAVITDEDER